MVVFLTVIFVLVMPVVVLAQSVTGSSTGISVTGTYTAGEAIAAGSIVAHTPSDTERIVKAGTNEVDRLVGVVVDSPENTEGDSDEQTAYATKVATSGTTWVYVSDINGAVTSGDKLTASPLLGIAMRATSSGPVVGTAQADFSEDTTGATTISVNDRRGESETVRVGKVLIAVEVSDWTAPITASDNEIVNTISSATSKLFAGQASVAQVLTVSLIALVVLIMVVTILYTAVIGGMQAIGRNPRAQPYVTSNLLIITGITLILLLAGVLVATYVLG